jgi:hypothetical protein
MEPHYIIDTVTDKNGTWNSKADALEWYRKELDAKQARIDELMLEYCPDEVTDEQWEEYSKHQVYVKMEWPWKDLTPQEVYDQIREGAADGGWQGFAQRITTAFKEKNK